MEKLNTASSPCREKASAGRFQVRARGAVTLGGSSAGDFGQKASGEIETVIDDAGVAAVEVVDLEGEAPNAFRRGAKAIALRAVELEDEPFESGGRFIDAEGGRHAATQRLPTSAECERRTSGGLLPFREPEQRCGVGLHQRGPDYGQAVKGAAER
jgi:hypothetical protein